MYNFNINTKLAKLVSPKYAYRYVSCLQPWLLWLTVLLLGVGLVWGLAIAPPDYQQGDAFRIIYLHVPCAVMSLFAYSVMSLSAAVFLIWRIKLADMVAKHVASLGVSFTLVALISGSLWGRPMWGTFWIWDARLTSELILLFLYLGVIALRRALPDPLQAAKASAILSLVGIVDLPVIHYSVYWWQTLHQKATLFQWAKPTIAPEMLYPLLVMLLACGCYFAAALCLRLRCELVAMKQS